MPATDNQGSFLNRIIIRRNSQVVSMENNHEELDLELFQKHVTDRFSDLHSPSAADHAPLLSISWFRKLLNVLLLCEAEFKAVVLTGRDPSHFSKPPLDRLDRSVKALDICNAVELQLHI
nr:Serine/arginine repetitive matrix protein like [Ipomoea batatas]